MSESSDEGKSKQCEGNCNTGKENCSVSWMSAMLKMDGMFILLTKMLRSWKKGNVLTISGKLYPVFTLLMRLGHDFELFQKVSNEDFLHNRILRERSLSEE